jgi:hypothetical protein
MKKHLRNIRRELVIFLLLIGYNGHRERLETDTEILVRRLREILPAEGKWERR